MKHKAMFRLRERAGLTESLYVFPFVIYASRCTGKVHLALNVSQMFRSLNEMGPRCLCSLSQFLDSPRTEIYSSLADAEENIFFNIHLKVMQRNIKLTTAIEIQSGYQYNWSCASIVVLSQ